MYPSVATKDPAAVAAEVHSIYLGSFPDGDPRFVSRVFGWVSDCFSGNYADYRPVDALYHDFEHTLQGTLCMARLLQGRHRAGAQPVVSRKLFELGLLAILLHDTGYPKKRDDPEGTGAKYTITHVERSADFAARLLAEKGYAAPDIRTVQNMIHCTGVHAVIDAIGFQSDEERIVGCALGTADLLGQMAADDYVQKLPALYEEFAEAARYSGDRTHFVSSYSSAEDLMSRTPVFWETFVSVKLNRDFGGLFRFLNQP
ncbi:MAG TPA: hypothetical protein PLH97_15705, partial [Verrucomicrobiota bacterium]|nr:hypothetical protein [Verrucomicrobiota bacterium]